MKRFLLLGLLLPVTALHAQDSTIAATDRLSVEGKVKKPYTFTLNDARRFVSIAIDSVTILNHRFEKVNVIHAVKGVLLKDIVEKAEVDAASQQTLSAFYIECIGSGGYKVVFSWNELFNTGIGYNVLLITEQEGLKGEEMPDRICLLSSTDHATGRRYVKGLQKVVVKQVE